MTFAPRVPGSRGPLPQVANIPDKPKSFVPKRYSEEVKELLSIPIKEGDDKEFADKIFEALARMNSLLRPEELILLEVVVYDLVRVRRLQQLLEKEGMSFKIKTRSGAEMTKMHEANWLLNSVTGSLRNNMKELLITKREKAKLDIGVGGRDFANWLADTKVIDLDGDQKDPDAKVE